MSLTTPETAICYPFPLRPDLIAQVLLPRNLSQPEADRLCDFVRSLTAPDAAPPPPERMMMIELPPLPDTDWTPNATLCHSAEQMRQYAHASALAAVLGEREACAAQCDSFGTLPSKVCAAAIRARGE